MNLRIEIDVAFQDTIEVLEDMLVDLADVIKKFGYANENDDEATLISYIRVKNLDDDEVIVVVVPVKNKTEEEKDEPTS